MINQSSQWTFMKRKSRPPLTLKQVEHWKKLLPKLLKVGIELEYNLPEKQGSCDKSNYLCKCVNVFNAPNPIPNTSKCYEQCAKWDGGNCEIAKKHGCAGVFCSYYKAPCSNCSKYDRGCNSCAELYDIKKDPKFVRKMISNELSPTNFVGEVGKTGTYKVCRDGSLLGDGGVEVATAGRRVSFHTIHEMMSNIMNSCTKYGAYVNERCSVHTHFLASYLNPGFDPKDRGRSFVVSEVSELEEPVPEVIVANFHQLVRRYQTSLIWMGSSGDHLSKMTRWEKFRKSVLPYSAVSNRMPQVVKAVAKASKNKVKYALMNYEPMVFNEDGNASRFHFEARYLDGMLSPAVVAAHVCLIYGLIMKAIEISRYGVLEIGDKEYTDRQKEIMSKLCNNDSDWNTKSRDSDTSLLGPHIPALIEQSKQLTRLLKTVLSDMGPANEILQKLAVTPPSLMRINGDDWETIERKLMPAAQEEVGLSEYIRRILDTSAVCECADENEWVETAAQQIAEDAGTAGDNAEVDKIKLGIDEIIKRTQAENQIHWSSALGSFVLS